MWIFAIISHWRTMVSVNSYVPKNYLIYERFRLNETQKIIINMLEGPASSEDDGPIEMQFQSVEE
jgi:hypothetical protein